MRRNQQRASAARDRARDASRQVMRCCTSSPRPAMRIFAREASAWTPRARRPRPRVEPAPVIVAFARRADPGMIGTDRPFPLAGLQEVLRAQARQHDGPERCVSRPRRSHRDRARAVEPTRTPRLLPSRRFARDTSRNTAVSPGASQPCGTAAVFFFFFALARSLTASSVSVARSGDRHVPFPARD